MSEAEYPDLTPEFGHWLAGFVDGEGSFVISAPRVSYICHFSLALRQDDRAILEECAARVGVGAVRNAPRSRIGNPCAVWAVGGKLPLLRLVEVFDHYPLRAKKANDFRIWRQAVLEWNRVGQGKGKKGTDWSYLAALKAVLNESRRYASHHSQTACTSDSTHGLEVGGPGHLPEREALSSLQLFPESL